MREFREIRLDLGADGTGDAAAPYISLARTQLGVLKNQLALGGRLQGRLTKLLPDGTQITVESMFGRDTIRIIAAAAVAATIAVTPVAAEEVTPETEIPAVPTSHSPIYVGQGYWYDNVTGNGASGYAYRWNGGGNPTDLGTADGNWDNLAVGVSYDGTVVAISAGGNTVSEALVWHKGSLINVGQLANTTNEWPVGVSKAGRVAIYGSGSGLNRYSGYWDPKAGLVDLQVHMKAYGISTDGNILYGMDVSSSVASFYNIKTGSYQTIPGAVATSVVTASSLDGSILAGYYDNGAGTMSPFIYTATGGYQSLPAPAAIYTPLAMSDDGKKLVLVTNASKGIAGVATYGFAANDTYIWSAAVGSVHLAAGIGACIMGDGTKVGGTLGSAGNLGMPVVWSMNGNAQVLTVSGQATSGIVFGMTDQNP